MENKTYWIYLFHKNKILSKFLFDEGEFDNLVKKYGNRAIVDGLKRDMSIDKQIKFYNVFIESLYKHKINCYKIRNSDHKLNLCSFLALYKLNKLKNDDENGIFIVRHKKNKMIKIKNKI